MDTKKVIPTITDVDTGEIIYQCKNDMCGKSEGYAYKTFNLGDFGATGEKFCLKVFESFLRGVKLGRNLSLHITVRDYVVPQRQNIF